MAEFIGTFPLIFIGAGGQDRLASTKIRPSRSRTVPSILVFVAAFCDTSGGHFNPAVTIGLTTAGVFPSRGVTPHIFAQIAGGGIAVAWVLLLALADRWPTLAPHWSISAMSTSKGAPA